MTRISDHCLKETEGDNKVKSEKPIEGKRADEITEYIKKERSFAIPDIQERFGSYPVYAMNMSATKLTEKNIRIYAVTTTATPKATKGGKEPSLMFLKTCEISAIIWIRRNTKKS